MMITTNWKQLLRDLKLQYLERNHPDFFKASGGHSMKIKPYDDRTANQLTASIQDFLKFVGAYSNRINSTGMMRKINGSMKWTKGTTNVGSADIRALFNGKSIDIEIKIGRDKMSEAQHKEQKRVESAGGTYIVATSFPQFLEQWLNLFPLSISSLSKTPLCPGK